MSRFKTQLVLRALEDDDGGLWELEYPLVYESDVAGEIIVPPKFSTDLASVPRIPIVYEAVGNHACKAAVVHDFLYVTRTVSREIADAVFREAMEVQGVNGWRRWVMWMGVRAGGGLYWKENSDPVEPPVGMGG